MGYLTEHAWMVLWFTIPWLLTPIFTSYRQNLCSIEEAQEMEVNHNLCHFDLIMILYLGFIPQDIEQLRTTDKRTQSITTVIEYIHISTVFSC